MGLLIAMYAEITPSYLIFFPSISIKYSLRFIGSSMFFPEYLLIQCITSYLKSTHYMLRVLNLFGFNNVNNIRSWLKL